MSPYSIFPCRPHCGLRTQIRINIIGQKALAEYCNGEFGMDKWASCSKCAASHILIIYRCSTSTTKKKKKSTNRNHSTIPLLAVIVAQEKQTNKATRPALGKDLRVLLHTYQARITVHHYNLPLAQTLFSCVLLHGLLELLEPPRPGPPIRQHLHTRERSSLTE